MDKVEQFDFLRYADDYGIEYTTHAGNLSKSWLLSLDCPFCGNHNGKHHLGIPASGAYGYCWRCSGKSLYQITRALTPSVNYYTLLETYGGYVDDRALLKKKKVEMEKIITGIALGIGGIILVGALALVGGTLVWLLWPVAIPATGFMGGAKSGVDPFQVATGRSSNNNTGESKFTGVQ